MNGDSWTEHMKTAVAPAAAPSARERRRASNPARFVETGRNNRPQWDQLTAVLLDLACIGLSSVLAYQLRIASIHSPASLFAIRQDERAYGAFVILYAILAVLICHSVGLYRGTSRLSDTEVADRVFRAVFLATTLLVAFVYFSGVRSVSRLLVVYVGVFNWLSMTLWRVVQRRRAEKTTGAGLRTRNVLIVGAGRVGKELAALFELSLIHI